MGDDVEDIACALEESGDNAASLTGHRVCLMHHQGGVISVMWTAGTHIHGLVAIRGSYFDGLRRWNGDAFWLAFPDAEDPKQVKLWDAKTKDPKRTLKGHGGNEVPTSLNS